MALSNDEVDQLERIIAAVAEIRARLRDWDRKFFDDVESRYQEHGADLRLSSKQWSNLERLYSYA